MIQKPTHGGPIIAGDVSVGGSLEPLYDEVTLAEVAVEKGAMALIMPVSCRRQLIDPSDNMATKVDIQSSSDARDALLKALQE